MIDNHSVPSHTHSISGTYPNMNAYGGWVQYPVYSNVTSTQFALTNPVAKQEPEMSMEDKIAKERKETRERAEVEAEFDAFDVLGLQDLDEGSVIYWMWDDLHIAAVLNDDLWSSSFKGAFFGVEELIAHLIAHGITPEQVEVVR